MAYRSTQAEYRREYQRKWYAANRSRLRKQGRLRMRQWRAANQERNYLSTRLRKDAFRDEAFAAYGGPVCACCGETTLGFLTLDHVAGDGKADRAQTKGYFYQALKRRGFPAGYQVLCMNCNWGRRLTGLCPHKKEAA